MHQRVWRLQVESSFCHRRASGKLSGIILSADLYTLILSLIGTSRKQSLSRAAGEFSKFQVSDIHTAAIKGEVV